MFHMGFLVKEWAKAKAKRAVELAGNAVYGTPQPMPEGMHAELIVLDGTWLVRYYGAEVVNGSHPVKAELKGVGGQAEAIQAIKTFERTNPWR